MNVSSLAELNVEVDSKQATLVSGTNIKSVGGISLLGSGDIPIGNTPITSTVGFAIKQNSFYYSDPFDDKQNTTSVISAVTHNGFLYQLVNEYTTAPAYQYVLYKIDLSTFQIVSRRASGSTGATIDATLVIDGTNINIIRYTSASFIYISTYTLSDLTAVSSFVIDTIGYAMGSLKKVFFDSTYWYIACISDLAYDTNIVIRARKDGASASYITLSKATTIMYNTGFAEDATYLYFSGTIGTNSKILKIDKATFTVTASIEFATPISYTKVVAVDANYVYLTTTSSSLLFRLNVSTLAYVDGYTFTTSTFGNAIQSGDYLYYGNGILRLSTLVAYTNTINLLFSNNNYFGQNASGICFPQSLQNIYKFYLSNGTTFGSSFISDNNILNYTPILDSSVAATALSTSNVLVTSAPTALTMSVGGAWSNTIWAQYPLSENCTYIDQI